MLAELREMARERGDNIEAISTSDGTYGFTTTGTRTDGREQRYTVVHRGSAVAQITFTYPPSSRELATSIAKSVSIDTHTPLDPAKLHGLDVGRVEGLSVDERISMIIVHNINETPPLPPASPTVDFSLVERDTSDGDVTLALLYSLLGDDVDRTRIKASEVKFDESTAVEFVGEAVDRGVRVQQISVFLVEQGAILHMRGQCALTDDLGRLRKVIYGTRRVALPPGAVPMSSREVETSRPPKR